MRVGASASFLGAVWITGCVTIVSYGDYSRAEDASAGNANDAASGRAGIGGTGGFPQGGTGGSAAGGTSSGGTSTGGTSTGGASTGGTATGGTSTGGTAAGGSAGMPGTGGNSGQGGTGGCVLQTDCPPPDPCFEMICDNGKCKEFASSPGSFCNGTLDQCDGFGFCVDCVNSGGCEECCVCRLNACVPI